MTLIVSAPRPTISSVTINDHPSRTLIQTNLYDRVMVIPNRLDYALLPLNIAQQIGASNSPPTISDTNSLDKVVYVSVDDQLVYARFFADFGPLDLGQTVRFCRDMTSRLSSDCPITLISSDHPHKHTNVMTLLVIFLVICHQHTPEQAISLFRTQRPPFGFRDAAYGICSFFISVLDCARAIYKAIQCNVWSYEMFALEEYEHYDQLVHGDINWIIPGKVLAFSGPQRERIVLNAKGATTLLVTDYVKIFKELGVTCVVRFNEPSTYDRNEFLHANIQHVGIGDMPQTLINLLYKMLARSGISRWWQPTRQHHAQVYSGRIGLKVGSFY